MRQGKKEMVGVGGVEDPISGLLFNHFLSLPHTQEMSHIFEYMSYTKFTENLYLEEKF